MGLNKKIRQYIFDRDKGECSYCYYPVDPNNFHIDHVIPRAKGGKDDVGNLVLSCPTCNIMKGARDEDEFVESITAASMYEYLDEQYGEYLAEQHFKELENERDEEKEYGY